MTRLLIIILSVLAGCDDPTSPGTATDRQALEAVVADCDTGVRSRGCDQARRALAAVRREDRITTYRRAL